MSSIAGPRGTSDVLPADQPYWRFVRDSAERVAARFGYQPIEIPIFEEAALFERGAGESSDIVRKELYRLEPRGDDSKRYAVRPEPTAGIARAYIQHGMASLPQPVKLCFFGPVLRYDRPQAGRVRQHTQFGIEALGEAGPEVDAEVIELLWRFYDEMGLRDLTMQINTIGDQNCRPAYIEKLRAYYRPLLDQVCNDDRERFEKNPLRLFDCKEERCRPIKLGAPKLADHLCDACREHFARLRGYLEALGIRYEVEPLLVRGLDYYTRTVFEAVPPGAGTHTTGTVGGGGRYDGLIELLGGRPTPGIGFGTGFERIILNLKRVGAEPPPLPRPEVYVAHVGESARAEAVLLVSELRRARVPAQLSFGGRSLKAQMRAANTAGAAYAAIIGDDEVRSGTVIVRDLRANEQREVPRGDVVARFTSGIGEHE